MQMPITSVGHGNAFHQKQLISQSARIPARLHEVSDRRNRNREPYFFDRSQKNDTSGDWINQNIQNKCELKSTYTQANTKEPRLQQSFCVSMSSIFPRISSDHQLLWWHNVITKSASSLFLGNVSILVTSNLQPKDISAQLCNYHMLRALDRVDFLHTKKIPSEP